MLNRHSMPPCISRWKPSLGGAAAPRLGRLTTAFMRSVPRWVWAPSTSVLGPDLMCRCVDVLPPIACHGVTRDSMFGLQRMRNSTVNARDSRFILVQALDYSRVTTLRPAGVSLCVGLIMKYHVQLLFFFLLGALPYFI